MAIGDKIFVADKETLDKAKNIVDNIQYIVKKSTVVPAPPVPDKDYVADKETLDKMYSALDGITTFSLNGNATAAQVLSGRTFFSNSPTRQTGTMANRSTQTSTSSYTAATFRSGTTGYIFCSPSVTGYYSTSSYLRVPVSNFSAANIKYNVNVGGIQGTYTNDGTATAGDLGVGKIAYSKGTRLVGTGENIQDSYVLQLIKSNSTYNNDFVTNLDNVSYSNNKVILSASLGLEDSALHNKAEDLLLQNGTYSDSYTTIQGHNASDNDSANYQTFGYNNYLFYYYNDQLYKMDTSASSPKWTAIDGYIYTGSIYFNNMVIMGISENGILSYSTDNLSSIQTKGTGIATYNTIADHFTEINGRLYISHMNINRLDTPYYYYSDDGLNWETATYVGSSFSMTYWVDYTTDGNIVLVINGSTLSGSSDNSHHEYGNLFCSINKGAFQPITIDEGAVAVEYIDGMFVLVGRNHIYTSTNGTSWTRRIEIPTGKNNPMPKGIKIGNKFIVYKDGNSYQYNTNTHTLVSVPSFLITARGLDIKHNYGTMQGYRVAKINTNEIIYLKE